MSYPTHLLCYKDHYYYQVRVPVDLRGHFKSSFIKKSLRTKHLNEAKLLMISMEYKVCRAFTLLRTGMLSDDLINLVVEDIHPTHKKNVITKNTLTKIIDIYVRQKESDWTYKTKMEVIGCYRLIVDIIGDVDIKSLNRKNILDFREKLQRLPANVYKCYPSKKLADVLVMTDIQPMSVNSANKHTLRLNALMSYAVREGFIPTNPAQGLMITDKRRDDELRKTYSFEDLQVIQKMLPIDPERPERLWIPESPLVS